MTGYTLEDWSGRQECGLRQRRTSLLDGRLPDSKEDLGLPLQLNCSQEAKMNADHFARITSVSTVLSVVNAVCNSEPVLVECWSDE